MSSRSVTSNQAGPHPKLEKVVRRQMAGEWKRPMPEFSEAASETLLARAASDGRPVILDAGCGVGMSTDELARRHPEHLVLGVDQSAHRIAKYQQSETPHPENAVVMRARAEDVWVAFARVQRPIEQLYFLYPNPWPKSVHLQRRWHAHGAFPAACASARLLVLRTNWKIYAEEFAQALGMVTEQTPAVVPLADVSPLTPFEKKYLESGHALYEVRGGGGLKRGTNTGTVAL